MPVNRAQAAYRGAHRGSSDHTWLSPPAPFRGSRRGPLPGALPAVLRRRGPGRAHRAEEGREGGSLGAAEDGPSDRRAAGRGEQPPPPAGCAATWALSNMVAAHTSHSASSGEWIACLDKRYRARSQERLQGDAACVYVCMCACVRDGPPCSPSRAALHKNGQVGSKMPGGSRAG